MSTLVVSKREGIISNQRGAGFHHYRLMHVLEHSPLRYPEYNLLDPLWIVNFWSWASLFFLSAEESFMITITLPCLSYCGPGTLLPIGKPFLYFHTNKVTLRPGFIPNKQLENCT